MDAPVDIIKIRIVCSDKSCAKRYRRKARDLLEMAKKEETNSNNPIIARKILKYRRREKNPQVSGATAVVIDGGYK